MKTNDSLVLNTNVTVESLRKQGFKVRVTHIRKLTSKGHASMYSIRELGLQEDIVHNGGITEVAITTPNKEVNVTGVAECSKKDQYNKKVGVQYALSRALKHFNDMGYNLVVYSTPNVVKAS